MNEKTTDPGSAYGYHEHRIQALERQQERHSEEITRMREIQASQQTLMTEFAKQRLEDRQEAREDRKALIFLQRQANTWKGIVMAVVVVMTLIGPLVNQGVRYVLFGHPPTEGAQGLIKAN